MTLYDEDEEEERVVTIVTTLRNDVFSGCISKESPFGQAVLGRKVGDRITVKVSDSYSYEAVIHSITKEDDDGSAPLMGH